MPRPANTVLQGRIINACTTKPRTLRQVSELLCVPHKNLEPVFKKMHATGKLHHVGTVIGMKGHPTRTYSAKPTRLTRPILTVWRGPLPIEWRQ